MYIRIAYWKFQQANHMYGSQHIRLDKILVGCVGSEVVALFVLFVIAWHFASLIALEAFVLLRNPVVLQFPL